MGGRAALDTQKLGYSRAEMSVMCRGGRERIIQKDNEEVYEMKFMRV